MADRAIVFALANPEPEIDPSETLNRQHKDLPRWDTLAARLEFLFGWPRPWRRGVDYRRGKHPHCRSVCRGIRPNRPSRRVNRLFAVEGVEVGASLAG